MVVHHQWVEEFPGAILVCDTQGIILEMNERAVKQYTADGGRALIGKNVLDCHPEPARTKLQRLMEARLPNAYTIEKRGVKKLVYQAPWYRGGQYAGFVELAFEIPVTMPHFVRDKPAAPAGKP
jgi:transcriptional regulator with PAS, ATPase and Fis domain